MPSPARGLHLGPSLHQHPYYVYASNGGFTEPAHLHPSLHENVINTNTQCVCSNICDDVIYSLVRDVLMTFAMYDLGVASSIQARSHTFVEIDHEIISTFILLPSAE